MNPRQLAIANIKIPNAKFCTIVRCIVSQDGKVEKAEKSVQFHIYRVTGILMIYQTN